MPDAERQEVEAILGRALLTAETFASEMRQRIVSRVSRRRMAPQEILTIARSVLEDFEPVLAQAMTDAELAAWVSGANSVVRILPAEAEGVLSLRPGITQGPPGGPVTPVLAGGGGEPIVQFPLIERAAESLIERDIVTRPVFDRLERQARAKAFTVARQDSVDAINTIRNVLAETTVEGASLGTFRQKLGEALDGSFIGPAHRETVYRTNIQAAFHQAHDELASNPVVSQVFPYQSYEPIDDSRTREEHFELKSLGLDGTNVYRRDDPFWNLFTPPWDFNCRCGVNLLTVEAAARRGVREAKEWQETDIAPAVPEWRIADIPFRPDPGFIGGRSRVA